MGEVIKHGTRTARKQHRCMGYPFDGHCIKPGTTYEFQVIAYGGTVYEWRACPYHAAVVGWIHRIAHWDTNTDGVDEDDVYEYLHNMWHDATADANNGTPHPMPFDVGCAGVGG